MKNMPTRVALIVATSMAMNMFSGPKSNCAIHTVMKVRNSRAPKTLKYSDRGLT